MKAITWATAIGLGLAAVAATSCSKSSSSATSDVEWGTDIDQALQQAKSENKSVMVEFTGSTWCPPCIMMNKEVFSKADFYEGATEDFVLVKIDLPAGLDSANSTSPLQEANCKVAEKYSVTSVPSIVLLDAEGKEFSRFFASDYPKTDQFLAHLDKILTLRQPN